MGGHDERSGHVVDLLETLGVLVTISEGGLGLINRSLHVSQLRAEVGVGGITRVSFR